MENKPFYIAGIGEYFEKGDIITAGHLNRGVKHNGYIVLKKYKKTWWRRLFKWLGFKSRMGQVKVKQYE